MRRIMRLCHSRGRHKNIIQYQESSSAIVEVLLITRYSLLITRELPANREHKQTIL